MPRNVVVGQSGGPSPVINSLCRTGNPHCFTRRAAGALARRDKKSEAASMGGFAG